MNVCIAAENHASVQQPQKTVVQTNVKVFNTVYNVKFSVYSNEMFSCESRWSNCTRLKKMTELLPQIHNSNRQNILNATVVTCQFLFHPTSFSGWNSVGLHPQKEHLRITREGLYRLSTNQRFAVVVVRWCWMLINEVNLRRARLVLGWVTLSGFDTSFWYVTSHSGRLSLLHSVGR